MKSIASAATVIVLALALLVSCGGQEKINMKLALSVGDIHHLRLTTDQQIVQEIMGQKQEVSQKIAMGYMYEVKNMSDEGNALVQVTYQTIQFDQTSPQGTVHFDSEQPADSVPAGAMGLAALVGQSFDMLVAPSAHIIEIQGIDQLITRMMEKLGVPTDSTGNRVRASLEEQFGGDALREAMENLMAIYPENAVSVGDTWTATRNITKGFPMKIADSLTFKERSDGVATIAIDAVISSNPDVPPLQMGQLQVVYDVSGTQTGTMQIDEQSGWIVHAEQVQKVSGDMKVLPNPQMPDGMSWPINMTTTATVDKFE
ncbi:MAG: DUF6263 family protein [Candidatus Zixiibacteriota bacterium]|jgi:hypothetical protein